MILWFCIIELIINTILVICLIQTVRHFTKVVTAEHAPRYIKLTTPAKDVSDGPAY